METLMSETSNGSVFASLPRPKATYSAKYTKITHDFDEDEFDDLDVYGEAGEGCRRVSDNEEVALMSNQEEYLENNADEKTYTVEDAVESLGFGVFQLRLFFICGLFTAADALEMMLLAVLSPVLKCEWQLDQFSVAFITTVVFVGMGVMAPFWGLLGDKFGRRTTLYMVSIWIGYFGLLTTFSPSYAWILILRCLVGGGLAGSPQSFAILTEYLPSNHRAKLLNLTQIAWALGSSFEIVIAALVIPTLGWRWLLVFSSIPCLLIVLLQYKFLPESARYLVAAGKAEDAVKVLRKAARLNNATLPEGRLVSKQTDDSRGNMKDLFSRMYRRTTLQLWLLWFITAFSYYGMVLASSEILQVHNAKEQGGNTCSCNLLKYDDYITMVLSTFGEFVCLPVNMILIDYIGRRYTGAVSYTGCAVFFVLLQLDVSQHVLTSLMFMVRGFSAGNFNYVYIYTAEVYPTTVRTLGIGTSSAWARVGAMVTPFVAQVLLDTSLAASVWVYGSLGICAAICSCLLPIETKARLLPQTVNLED